MTSDNFHRDSDPFNLDRFVTAQRVSYEGALDELRSGQKEGHWMWFIFPQLDGLGVSARICLPIAALRA